MRLDWDGLQSADSLYNPCVWQYSNEQGFSDVHTRRMNMKYYIIMYQHPLWVVDVINWFWWMAIVSATLTTHTTTTTATTKNGWKGGTVEKILSCQNTLHLPLSSLKVALFFFNPPPYHRHHLFIYVFTFGFIVDMVLLLCAEMNTVPWKKRTRWYQLRHF